MRSYDKYEAVSGCFSLIFILVVGISWVVNFNKLTNCDFESPYRCEVLHTFGLIPMVSMVSVWYDTDD